MANKGGNPNSEGRGKPTRQVGFSGQFVSPFNAEGKSKSWPTVPADMAKLRQPANPLGIKHATGANNARKDNKA
jgi:hypothetical protein